MEAQFQSILARSTESIRDYNEHQEHVGEASWTPSNIKLKCKITNAAKYCKYFRVLETLQSITNTRKYCKYWKVLQILQSLAILQSITNTGKYCKYCKVLKTLQSIADYNEHQEQVQEAGWVPWQLFVGQPGCEGRGEFPDLIKRFNKMGRPCFWWRGLYNFRSIWYFK